MAVKSAVSMETASGSGRSGAAFTPGMKGDIEYLRRHEIAISFERALQEILRDKPDDPFKAMGDILARQKAMRQQGDGGIAVADPGLTLQSASHEARAVENQRLKEQLEDVKKQLLAKHDELQKFKLVEPSTRDVFDPINPLVSCIIDTDSYKLSHWKQYPPGTTSMFSYFESRGGDFPATIFFGLQYYLKRYLSRPLTQRDVTEGAAFSAAH
eukprot:283793_1